MKKLFVLILFSFIGYFLILISSFLNPNQSFAQQGTQRDGTACRDYNGYETCMPGSVCGGRDANNNRVCVKKNSVQIGGYCELGSADVCANSICGSLDKKEFTGICVAKNSLKNGDLCDGWYSYGNLACISGYCGGGAIYPICIEKHSKNEGQSCSEAEECLGDLICDSRLDKAPRYKFYADTNRICASKNSRDNGSYCHYSSVCKSGFCGGVKDPTQWDNTICIDKGSIAKGKPCNPKHHDSCQSGYCGEGYICSDKKTKPIGGGCNNDDDCKDDGVCASENTKEWICVKKNSIQNGGTCLYDRGCQSNFCGGVGNGTTINNHTCIEPGSIPNGTRCSTGKACMSGLCGGEDPSGNTICVESASSPSSNNSNKCDQSGFICASESKNELNGQSCSYTIESQIMDKYCDARKYCYKCEVDPSGGIKNVCDGAKNSANKSKYDGYIEARCGKGIAGKYNEAKARRGDFEKKYYDVYQCGDEEVEIAVSSGDEEICGKAPWNLKVSAGTPTPTLSKLQLCPASTNTCEDSSNCDGVNSGSKPNPDGDYACTVNNPAGTGMFCCTKPNASTVTPAKTATPGSGAKCANKDKLEHGCPVDGFGTCLKDSFQDWDATTYHCSETKEKYCNTMQKMTATKAECTTGTSTPTVTNTPTPSPKPGTTNTPTPSPTLVPTSTPTPTQGGGSSICNTCSKLGTYYSGPTKYYYHSWGTNQCCAGAPNSCVNSSLTSCPN